MVKIVKKTQSNISVHLKSALAEGAWLSKRGNVVSLLILVLLVGGLVRIANLGYSSLWCDEAWVGLSKRQGDLSPEGTLRYYTLLQNVFWYLSVRFFGDSEFSLRLPSVLYGVTTLALAYHITRKLTASYLAGLFVAALAVCNDNWVYSSRECKPQAGELLSFCIVSVVFISYLQDNLNYRRALLGPFLLALAIGLGNWAAIIAAPSIFFVICVRLGSAANRPDKDQLFLLVINLIAVLFITLAWYLWLSESTAGSNLDASYTQYGALPSEHAGFLDRLEWAFRAVISLPTHLYPHWSKPGKVLWAVAMLATIWGIIRWPREVSFYRFWVCAILMLFLGLGFVGRYPWGGRFAEWIQVALLPFAGLGLAQFLGRSGVKVGLLRIGFAVLITAALGRQIHRTVIVPHVQEHIRPLVAYLESHAVADDNIIVSKRSIAGFDYYWKSDLPVKVERMSLPIRDRRHAWKGYLSKLPLRISTTWILFSHDGSGQGLSENEFVEQGLDELGISYESFDEAGARLIRVPPKNGNQG